MIHVDRSSVAVPQVLQSAETKKELKRALEFFSLPAQSRAQQQYRLSDRFYNDREVRASLNKLFQGKCAYCESPLLGSGEIEHFRPRSRAMGLDGVVATDHYWWLAYEWSNIYLVCELCNRMKATRFPIRGSSRASPGSTVEDLAKEKPLLLDPCFDRPEEHLVFSDNGQVASRTDQGMTTIEVLGLNREVLVKERQELYKSLRFIYAVTIKRLGKTRIAKNAEFRQQLTIGFDAERRYAAFHRQFIKQWLHAAGVTDWSDLLAQPAEELNLISPQIRERAVIRTAARGLRQSSYSVEKKTTRQKEVYYSGAKRIERIEITNFKAIQSLELRFSPPKSERESWLMVLGENGTGKSSILQAVGLALMGQQHSNDLGLDASRFVRAKARDGKGSVKVYLTNIPEPIVLKFNRRSKRFTVDPKDPKVLLLGYGATRLLPRHTREKGSIEKYIRVKNLFIPTAPLNDTEAWLSNRKKVPRNRFAEVAKALKDLLMLEDSARFSRARGVVKVNTIDGQVTLHDLSDGFQSVVAMCTDIMISLLERWEDMQVAEGIVLLDELEVHLHPSWKIEIVERLRRCFPRVTFLVTTHDPLCLRGLSDNEIIVLRRDEYKRVAVMTQIPSVGDLRADQILTNPLLFGLRSTIGKPPEAVSRYTELMKKEKKTAKEEMEIKQLRTQLEKLFSPAESRLEQQIHDAVQEALLQTSPPKAADDQPESLKQTIDQASPELRLFLKRQLNGLLRK